MSAVHKDAIPAVMKAHNQWVLWRYEERANGKKTKPPYRLDGKKAKSNTPDTWCSFDDAVSAQGFDGVGFCFSENDGLFGIDLDHCMRDGELLDWASEIVQLFNPTYVEYSPSGEGIHILGKGKPLATGQRKWTDAETGQQVGFEIYDYTSPRYFTVTGDVIIPNEVTECQKQLQQLWEMYFADDEELPAEQAQPQGGLKQAVPNRVFVENALRNIPADEYGTWIKVGMALKAGGFEMELWDKWSATCKAKYEAGACAAKWETLNPQKVTIGSIFYLANQYAPRPAAPPTQQVAAAAAPPAVSSASTAEQQTAAAEVASYPPPTNVVPIQRDGNYIEHSRWYPNKVPMQYRLTDAGVFKLGDDSKKYGELFCGPIYVLAETHSPRGDGGAGLVLEMQTRRGNFITMSIPRNRLYEDAKVLAQELGRMGVDLMPGKEKELVKYLAVCAAQEYRISVDQTGWVDGTDINKLIYVFPEGATEEGYHFQPERYSPSAFSYREQGTLKEYVENVFQPIKNKPYPVFALLASLSAVLQKFKGREGGGGFHFHGSSSSGKTALAQIAASPFGCGADPSDASDSYIRRWNTTANALEGLAAAHNDSPIVLDEMASFGGKDFGKAVYDVTGGQGKAAMDASRNLKKQRTWRSLVISTGEISSRSKIESELVGSRNKQAKAGQLLRLIDIQVSSSIFSGREEVNNLKRACGQYFGTLAPAFIRALINQFDATRLANTVQVWLDSAMARLANVHPGMNHQTQTRALERFAMAEVAGKLLVQTGIIAGFTNEDVERSLNTVVSDWAPASIFLNDDERALNGLRDFILSNRDARFKSYKRIDGTDKLNREIAGFFDSDRQVFFVYPAAIREATGCEPKQVALALAGKDMLLREKQDRFTYRIYIHNQYVSTYAIKVALLGTDNET